MVDGLFFCFSVVGEMAALAALETMAE